MTGAVVKLPTAAARKVVLPTPRRCEIAISAGSATRLPVRWKGRYQREKEADEATFADMERTPALLIAMALLRATDAATRRKAIATILAAAERTPCTAGRQATAIVATMMRQIAEDAR